MLQGEGGVQSVFAALTIQCKVGECVSLESGIFRPHDNTCTCQSDMFPSCVATLPLPASTTSQSTFTPWFSFVLSIFQHIVPQISLPPMLGLPTQQAACCLENGELGPSTLVYHCARDLIPCIESLRTPFVRSLSVPCFRTLPCI